MKTATPTGLACLATFCLGFGTCFFLQSQGNIGSFARAKDSAPALPKVAALQTAPKIVPIAKTKPKEQAARLRMNGKTVCSTSTMIPERQVQEYQPTPSDEAQEKFVRDAQLRAMLPVAVVIGLPILFGLLTLVAILAIIRVFKVTLARR